ncbi:AbrB/MazE/SpoVT family DNA-binding domain-containing protein [Mesorhizobium sp. CC13]|uniref:AbrB/MazE/SpoVT family DNA-binding domain-containing protein n=1 Tax=Mesorhizobium sp. CC13 TaxID=3029194 RepID=UPI0032678A88
MTAPETPKGFAEEPQKGLDTPVAPSVPYVRLKIGEGGRIVIPAEMRAAMLVKPGDTVTARVVDGEFRIVSPGVALKRVQAEALRFRQNNPTTSVVDEFIAERRAEAAREAAEADDWRERHGLPSRDDK